MKDFFSGISDHLGKLAGHLASFEIGEFLVQLIELFIWLFEQLIVLIGWMLSQVWFILLGIIVVPAMWIMAHWYPTWEKWIREAKELPDHLDRLLLIIPLTGIVLYGMIIYNLLHKTFEGMIKDRFGLNPFK